MLCNKLYPNRSFFLNISKLLSFSKTFTASINKKTFLNIFLCFKAKNCYSDNVCEFHYKTFYDTAIRLHGKTTFSIMKNCVSKQHSNISEIENMWRIFHEEREKCLIFCLINSLQVMPLVFHELRFNLKSCLKV